MGALLTSSPISQGMVSRCIIVAIAVAALLIIGSASGMRAVVGSHEDAEMLGLAMGLNSAIVVPTSFHGTVSRFSSLINDASEAAADAGRPIVEGVTGTDPTPITRSVGPSMGFVTDTVSYETGSCPIVAAENAMAFVDPDPSSAGIKRRVATTARGSCIPYATGGLGLP